MEFWTKRTLQSIFLPGGATLLAAALLLRNPWFPVPAFGINYFYDAVFVAAVLLAWRFHSTRVLLCAAILLLAHYGIATITSPAGAVISGRSAFDAITLLIPVDFAVVTFIPDRSSERGKLLWFLVLLFFEFTFVAVFSRPDQPGIAFLHIAPVRHYHLRVPQLAFVLFVAALGYLVYRVAHHSKAIDHGMFWSLLASWLGIEARAASRNGIAYFGIAGFILASAIIENSYSLAYQDELTGLHSRRAFNEALLRLKRPFAVAAIDIDHFKSINDTYGHDTGDQVLRLVGSRLARVTGGGETFRVGGEEFAILFRGRLLAEVADHLELLRMQIEDSAFRVRAGRDRRKVPRDSERRAPVRRSKTPAQNGSGMLSVTVSLGLADSYPGFAPEQVVQHADQALYQAKRSGRNRLEIAGITRKSRRKVATARSAQP